MFPAPGKTEKFIKCVFIIIHVIFNVRRFLYYGHYILIVTELATTVIYILSSLSISILMSVLYAMSFYWKPLQGVFETWKLRDNKIELKRYGTIIFLNLCQKCQKCVLQKIIFINKWVYHIF